MKNKFLTFNFNFFLLISIIEIFKMSLVCIIFKIFGKYVNLDIILKSKAFRNSKPDLQSFRLLVLVLVQFNCFCFIQNFEVQNEC